MRWEAIRLLAGKELRQHLRRRGALVATLVAPGAILLVQGPATVLGVSIRSRPSPSAGRGVEFVIWALFPMLVAVSGLLVPSVATAAAIASEREKGALELLIALPVRVGEILVAKLAANALLSVAILFPLLAVDTGLLIFFHAAPPVYFAALYLLVSAAVAYAIGSSQLMTLIARDYRTANQFNGLLIMPGLGIVFASVVWLHSVAGLLVATAALAAVAAVTLVVALRWLTFERYLT